MTVTSRVPHTAFQPASVVELLRYRAAEQPDREAYSFLADGEPRARLLTYAELDARACGVAAALRAIAAPGERALLLAPTSPEFLSGFFGCLYAGLVAVPAYPPSPHRPDARIAALAADSTPAVVLATGRVLGQLERHAEHYPALRGRAWLDLESVPADSAEGGAAPPPTAGLAFLQYTSGSTAAPRGVMLTHANLLANVRMIGAAMTGRPQTRGVNWVPLFHDMGMIGGILTPLYQGFPATLMSPLDFLQDPLGWLRTISELRATSSQAPNFGYELCARRISPEQRASLDLSCWNLAANGSEPVRAATLAAFAASFGGCGFRAEAFFPTFGIAEATLFAAGGSPADRPTTIRLDAAELAAGRVVPATGGAARTLVSCGRPAVGGNVVIADPVSRRALPAGEIGEIWLAGPHVAGGYWGRPDESAEAFGARLADDGRGPFFRTGDLGFLHDGELYVTGRLKDLIVVRGRNHHPQDIEQTVEASHPAIRPACSAAFSVDRAGEEQLAVVAEVERRYWPDPAELAGVADAIRRAVVAEHEVEVAAVRIVGSGALPKTSSGKLQRGAARQTWLADGFPSLYRWERPEVHAQPPVPVARPTAPRRLLPILLDHLRRECGPDGPGLFSANDCVQDLGLDSLRLVNLALALEQELGLAAPFALFEDNPTLRELSERLESGAPATTRPDLWAEATLDADWRPAPGQPATAPERVLLTGATGFLGAYLLRELLARTAASVACLVRASDAAAGRRRIVDNLAAYGLWDEAYGERIHPVPGDLASPRFGLDEREFERLAATLDAVYHNGAWLNFVHTYPTLRPANVIGTREALRLAGQGRPKAVHHISTTGVFAGLGQAEREYGEDARPDDPDGLPLGYLQSKWVAERLVWAAAERGLSVTVHRPGWILGDSRSGAGNPDDFLARLLRGCVALGSAPALEYRWHVAPVDLVGQAVVELASRPESTGRAFHLAEPAGVPWTELVAWLQAAGHALRLLPYAEWLAELRRRDDGPLAPLLPLFTERAVTGRPPLPELYAQAGGPRLTNHETQAALAGSGIACPPLDRPLFTRYLGFLAAGGYLAGR